MLRELPLAEGKDARRQSWPVLALSITLQVILALPFGHAYDTRIFMATGYLTATGQNPYIAQDLSAVFNNSLFQGMTSIGYPPPWPLALGLIYQISYRLVTNLLLYNLAIKIPILAANILVAFLVAKILKHLDAGEKAVYRAWVFMLLNPATLYFSTAWGQIDSIVALFSLATLALLYYDRPGWSALSLALAVAMKPTALPLILAALIYLAKKSLRKATIYLILFLAALFILCVVPFTIFSWDPSPIFHGWNAHFSVGGAMSFMTFWEFTKDTYQLNGGWWLLGLLWIPALIAFSIPMIKSGVEGFDGLLMKSAGLLLVFFLTRSWLSEPNILLLIPFILILTSIGKLHPWALTAVWALPLVFTIANASAPQLLFPGYPDLMQKLLLQVDSHRDARLFARMVLVVPWLAASWWMALACFKPKGFQKDGAWR